MPGRILLAHAHSYSRKLHSHAYSHIYNSTIHTYHLLLPVTYYYMHNISTRAHKHAHARACTHTHTDVWSYSSDQGRPMDQTPDYRSCSNQHLYHAWVISVIWEFISRPVTYLYKLVVRRHCLPMHSWLDLCVSNPHCVGIRGHLASGIGHCGHWAFSIGIGRLALDRAFDVGHWNCILALKCLLDLLYTK